MPPLGSGYDRLDASGRRRAPSVRLFAGLSQRQLRQLARLAKEREYRPGVTVVEEGTMSGIGFFIVAEGEGS